MTDNALKIEEAYHPNGKIKSRICKNAQDQLHNPAGPAEQYWHSNGQLEYQAFWINGQLHNPHDLAVEYRFENGQLFYRAFYLNGEYLTEAEWKAQVNPVPVIMAEAPQTVNLTLSRDQFKYIFCLMTNEDIRHDVRSEAHRESQSAIPYGTLHADTVRALEQIAATDFSELFA